ncbi:MAG: F0F1 ATP synthase subunit epsilon [Planctomycetaceae bacterium]|jgi:ATP synthase F1 epsilon subunit|nr:F0F1 ATP synthase subunit epsilon [Planctomycetaceae bacterium]
MSESKNMFKCTIVSPAGKLLDCSASSVIFIAHDGSVGVMSHHMPMLCELGIGIMEINLPHTDTSEAGKKFALIDGGFALVHSNVVHIIAADAVIGWDAKKDKINILVDANKRKLKDTPEKSPQHAHLLKKNILLEQLLTYHSA